MTDTPDPTGDVADLPTDSVDEITESSKGRLPTFAEMLPATRAFYTDGTKA